MDFFRTDFIITCSIDGHIKFWKKQEFGIEFVKHFRGHLGNIQDVAINASGSLLCTLSNDKSLKVFDVVNFGTAQFLKIFIVSNNCYNNFLSLSRYDQHDEVGICPWLL